MADRYRAAREELKAGAFRYLMYVRIKVKKYDDPESASAADMAALQTISVPAKLERPSGLSDYNYSKDVQMLSDMEDTLTRLSRYYWDCLARAGAAVCMEVACFSSGTCLVSISILLMYLSQFGRRVGASYYKNQDNTNLSDSYKA